MIIILIKVIIIMIIIIIAIMILADDYKHISKRTRLNNEDYTSHTYRRSI